MQLPAQSPLVQKVYAPASLTAIATHAELVYAAASVDDWAAAESQLTWFDAGYAAMDADVPDQDAYKSQINAALINLRSAVTSRDRRGAMLTANEITRVVAFMSEPLNPLVPTNVALLGYYARQMLYASDAGDIATLKALAAQVHRTWYAFRPNYGAVANPTQGEMIEGIISGLDGATTAGDFDTLSRQLIDAIQDLEEQILAEQSYTLSQPPM